MWSRQTSARIHRQIIPQRCPPFPGPTWEPRPPRQVRGPTGDDDQELGEEQKRRKRRFLVTFFETASFFFVRPPRFFAPQSLFFGRAPLLELFLLMQVERRPAARCFESNFSPTIGTPCRLLQALPSLAPMSGVKMTTNSLAQEKRLIMSHDRLLSRLGC